MNRLEVLRGAVRCAIRNGCPRSAISVPHWSRTYGVSMKAVRDMWEAEMTKSAPGFEAGSEK